MHRSEAGVFPFSGAEQKPSDLAKRGAEALLPRPRFGSNFFNREPQAAGMANLHSIAEEQNEACISAARGKASECSVQRLRVSFPSQDGMDPG